MPSGATSEIRTIQLAREASADTLGKALGKPSISRGASRGVAVVDETVVIHFLLVGWKASPPHDGAAALHAHGGFVDVAMGGLVRGACRQRMIGRGVKGLGLDALNRPTVFPSPIAGAVSRSSPGACQSRTYTAKGGSSMMPVSMPLSQWSNQRTASWRHSILGPGYITLGPPVIIGSDQGLYRGFDVFQHPRQGVAVSVVPASDVKAGRLNLVVLVQ